MKKILSIALIAALFVTSAFAVSFTGSAALNLGYNLDSKAYGFENVKEPVLTFGFELGTGDGSSAGEKDLKAEIAGTFTVSFEEKKYTETGDLSVGATVTTLKITKANILYKDVLTVGILDAGKPADYASSFNVKDGETLSDQVGAYINSLKSAPGFTVKYNPLNVSGGFGLAGDASKSLIDVVAHANLADLALVENLKASFGAGVVVNKVEETSLSDKGTYTDVLASAKVAYDDSDKISASFAADFDLHVEKKSEKTVTPMLEASVAAKYDFVSADLYLYSVDKFENVILDAKAAAEYTFAENYTVTGAFKVYNAANKTRSSKDTTSPETQEFQPELKVKAVVNDFTFTVGGSYGIKGKALAVYGKVEYKADMFSANFTADYNKTIGTDKTSQLYFTAGIESKTVVDGATLALTYGKANSSDKLNVLKDQEIGQKLGKITASAKISF